VVGGKIDADHPVAKAYLAPQKEAAAEGLDPLYGDAIAACRDAGEWSVNHIQKSLKCARDRAASMARMMRQLGVWKTGGPAPPQVAEPAPKLRGQAVAHEKKKYAEADAEEWMREQREKLREQIGDLAGKSLEYIVQYFGTDARFVDWLRACKEIAAIEERNLKNAEKRGDLVNRRIIKHGLLDHIETMVQLILTDGAKTITRRVVAKSKGGESIEEIEKWVSGHLSSFVKPAKAKIDRTLREVAKARVE
jgi:hypothetical protein